MPGSWWFMTKVAVAGGVVYWTAYKGIWSDNRQGVSALNEATSKLEVYHVYRDWKDTSFVGMWNNGVKTVFDKVANGPSALKDAGSQGFNTTKRWISDNMK